MFSVYENIFRTKKVNYGFSTCTLDSEDIHVAVYRYILPSAIDYTRWVESKIKHYSVAFSTVFTMQDLYYSFRLAIV